MTPNIHAATARVSLAPQLFALAGSDSARGFLGLRWLQLWGVKSTICTGCAASRDGLSIPSGDPTSTTQGIIALKCGALTTISNACYLLQVDANAGSATAPTIDNLLIAAPGGATHCGPRFRRWPG